MIARAIHAQCDSLGLASCLWLVQETPYSNLASGRLLTFTKEVLTRLLIEIDNGRDRLKHTVATFSATVLGVQAYH